MTDQPLVPILVKSIPDQVVNERATFGPLDFNEYFQIPGAEPGSISFFAELASGASLPKGLICTSDGKLQGLPASGTQGDYAVNIVAEGISGEPTHATFILKIKPSLAARAKEDLPDEATLRALKQRVWDAIGHDQPIPDIGDLFVRPFRTEDLLYLLERWATFTIWDAYNLAPPEDRHLLELADNSPHYNIYDCGSCLIAAPKDLYSHQRSLEDALQAARAMANEVYKRGWNVVEFWGFKKMQRAAWVEMQAMAGMTGRELEVMNYTPNQMDIDLYNMRSATVGLRPGQS